MERAASGRAFALFASLLEHADRHSPEAGGDREEGGEEQHSERHVRRVEHRIGPVAARVARDHQRPQEIGRRAAREQKEGVRAVRTR